jgi:hypothetical protein
MLDLVEIAFTAGHSTFSLKGGGGGGGKSSGGADADAGFLRARKETSKLQGKLTPFGKCSCVNWSLVYGFLSTAIRHFIHSYINI